MMEKVEQSDQLRTYTEDLLGTLNAQLRIIYYGGAGTRSTHLASAPLPVQMRSKQRIQGIAGG